MLQTISFHCAYLLQINICLCLRFLFDFIRFGCLIVTRFCLVLFPLKIHISRFKFGIKVSYGGGKLHSCFNELKRTTMLRMMMMMDRFLIMLAYMETLIIVSA